MTRDILKMKFDQRWEMVELIRLNNGYLMLEWFKKDFGEPVWGGRIVNKVAQKQVDQCLQDTAVLP